jgi:hypothetical protein
MLRGRAARAGSAGLVRRRGRPPKLTARQQVQAAAWAGQGRSQEWIGQRLGVARSVIGRVLADAAPVQVQPSLIPVESADAEPAETDLAQVELPQAEPAEASAAAASQGGGVGSARIGVGSHGCRYAGAMLAHAYLDRVGAGQVFATVAGGPARRYDDLGVLSTAPPTIPRGPPSTDLPPRRGINLHGELVPTSGGLSLGCSVPAYLAALRSADRQRRNFHTPSG